MRHIFLSQTKKNKGRKMLNALKNRAWLPYFKKINGTVIQGDTYARPTNFLNWVYQIFFGWKKEVILAVRQDVDPRGYYIGFKPATGIMAKFGWSWLRAFPITGLFRVRIGRENVIFFAINQSGNEVPLKIVEDMFDPNAASLIQRI